MTYLAHFYLAVSGVMPCLTAQMLNIWHPIAFALKGSADPIYAVGDNIRILWPVTMRHAAEGATLLLLTVYAWRASREAQECRPDGPVMLFLFPSLVLPFVMTSAHENHLYFASILLTLLLGSGVPKGVRYAVHAML
jgi:hypothetical protein